MQQLVTDLPAPKPLTLDGVALFLDLDGTLAPIEARPQDVRPDPRRTRLIANLIGALHGRLAVISGRTLADVDRILEGCVTAVAAVHGLVLRDAAGRIEETRPCESVRVATDGFLTFAAGREGLIVEEKGPSVALHFRLAAQYADAATACAHHLATATGLTLQEGNMVAELRTPGPGKGDSVRAFMRRAPFVGARPVFLGDDATDEDGFEAAEALGGFGVAIGPRPSARARYRLQGVEPALAWLENAR